MRLPLNSLLIFATCLTTALLGACQKASVASSPDNTDRLVPTQPNVLVFLVDDMGVMDTSVPFMADAQGNPVSQPLNQFYRTPNMESFAAHSVRFSRFYANSVCSPSRTSLLNGQSSARHHTTQWILSEKRNSGPEGWKWEGLTAKDVTLPALLSAAGYDTIHCGKAHLGPYGHEGENPVNVGFRHNIGGSSIGQPGSYYGEKNYGKDTSRPVPHLESYHGSNTFLTDALTLEAIKAIDRANDNEMPFFMQMSHYALHTPHETDSRFIKNYQSVEGFENVSKQVRAFATLVEGMDKSFGDLLAHLEQIDEAENTLVIFLGDNGTDGRHGNQNKVACAAPLRGMKGTHYEGGMRAPLMIGWAKANPDSELQKQFPISSGLASQDLVCIYDLFPTILQVAGVGAPTTHIVDGKDLTSCLNTHQREGEPTFLMHFPHNHRSSYFTCYYQGKWKFVYHYRRPMDKRIELFDLSQDIAEDRNLAKSNPAQARKMFDAMVGALNDADAQYFTTKTGETLLPVWPYDSAE